jgi:hypothetical protein
MCAKAELLVQPRFPFDCISQNGQDFVLQRSITLRGSTSKLAHRPLVYFPDQKRRHASPVCAG